MGYDIGNQGVGGGRGTSNDVGMVGDMTWVEDMMGLMGMTYIQLFIHMHGCNGLGWHESKLVKQHFEIGMLHALICRIFTKVIEILKNVFIIFTCETCFSWKPPRWLCPWLEHHHPKSGHYKTLYAGRSPLQETT